MSSLAELGDAIRREFYLPDPNFDREEYDQWQKRIEHLLESGAVEVFDAAAQVIGGETDLRDAAAHIDGVRPGVILKTGPIDVETTETVVYTAAGFRHTGSLEGTSSETRYLTATSDGNELLLSTGYGRSNFRTDDYPDARGGHYMHYDQSRFILPSLHSGKERNRLIDIMVAKGITERTAVPQLRDAILSLPQ